MAQNVERISDSVVCQIAGDGNSVTITHNARSILTLELPAMRARDARKLPSPVLRVLNTYLRATTFVGRHALRDQFVGWLRSGEPFAIRVLTGAGGAGKTRFALELIDAVGANTAKAGTRVPAGQWCAGFLREAPELALPKETAFRLANPVLVVVDYASSLRQVLREWLRFLSLRFSEGSSPIRVLLLDREASVETGWLRELQEYRSDSDVGLAGYFTPSNPIPLEPLDSVRDRRAIFEQMGKQFAELEGKSFVLAQDNPQFDEQLAQDRWSNPLHVIMAAATAVEVGLPCVLAMSRSDLAQHRAAREISRMRDDSNAGLGRRSALPVYLAACSTVARGLGRDHAVALAQKVLALAGREYPDGAVGLASQTAAFLPGAEDTAIGRLEPDIIGEAFVYHGLTCDAQWHLSDAQIAELLYEVCVIGVADQSSGDTPEAFLIRLWQDHCGAYEVIMNPATQTPILQSLVWFDGLVAAAQQNDDFSFLLRLANALPEQSIALAPKALDLYQTLLGVHKKLAAARPDAFLPDLATSLNNLATLLSELGRREEALAAGQRAVEIREKLAAARPDAFLPYLAMSLNNLANLLSELGRREEALAAGQRAVEIREKLAAARPDAFLPGLAMSLNNLANRLSELGRREEALAAGQRAVEIREKLAAARPDAFLPYLAMSLNNLANRLSELGRR
ncbi:MAG TPA: tetratricopeptide repeat protein, partial [Sedimentisphaerales bacterium]|nr:tetratricopeptide repeat protein [Sedimentisphaerales bacterium]